jgi:VanZ like family
VTPTQPGSTARYLLWYWGPVVLWMAVIFVGSSLARLPAIPGGFSDKTAHASEYAVFGFLLARGLAGPRWLSITLRSACAAVVLATLYGVTDEFHQRFVPGRDFEVRDMMADAAGSSLSAGALWVLSIIRRGRRTDQRPGLTTSDQDQRPTTNDQDQRLTTKTND